MSTPGANKEQDGPNMDETQDVADQTMTETPRGNKCSAWWTRNNGNEYSLLIWDGLEFFTYSPYKLTRHYHGGEYSLYDKLVDYVWKATTVLFIFVSLMVLIAEFMKIGHEKSTVQLVEASDSFEYSLSKGMSIHFVTSFNLDQAANWVNDRSDAKVPRDQS